MTIISCVGDEKVSKQLRVALQADGSATPATAEGALSAVEDFRKSISRPSGLRAPGSAGQSKIGGPRGGAGVGSGKSRLLSNIERMGRSAGAGGMD